MNDFFFQKLQFWLILIAYGIAIYIHQRREEVTKERKCVKSLYIADVI